MESRDSSADNIEEAFHKLEVQCVGYEDYIECSEENFAKTLKGLEDLVTRI